MRVLLAVISTAGVIASWNSAQAIGCVSGAVAGGVAGHAVHHTVTGMVAGCIAGHEAHKIIVKRKQEKERRANEPAQQ